MNALDPRLERLLQRTGEGARGLAESPADSPAGPAPERVNVFIRFTGEVEPLLALGLSSPAVIEHPTEGYRLAAGTVPLGRAAEIAALPGVEQVELGQALGRELDRSVPNIHADDVHDDLGYTGAGVIIGIVDSGIDFRHEAFRDDQNKTRILYLWDQAQSQATTTAQAGRPPQEFPDLGMEFTKEEIDIALTKPEPLKWLATDDYDPDGHGTHVAGIAAGNGKPSGDCFGLGTYKGVAPEADLIVVCTKVKRAETDPNIGDATDISRALRYVFRKAAERGQPAVVNLSQGGNMGPHDGTSMLELWIDILLLERSGRAVVKSAGNEGTSKHHASGAVPAGQSLDLTFKMDPKRTGELDFELWYPGSERLTAQVFLPPGPPITRDHTAPVQPGTRLTSLHIANPNDPPDLQIWVDLASQVGYPGNGDNRILWAVGSWVPPPEGPWRLRLYNPGAAEVKFHAWVEHGEHSPTFTSGVDDDYLITTPGTAKRVITVANYSAGAFGTYQVGDRVESSSRGPVRAGNQNKPDIAAPGLLINSARSHPEKSKQCSDCCVNLFIPMSGTSMAAPHVAGVVALMLQKNPGLDADQILDILTTKKRDPPNVTVFPDRGYGYGLVDALKAVNAVPAPTPASGALAAAEGGKRAKRAAKKAAKPKQPKKATKRSAAPGSSTAPIPQLSVARLRKIQSRLLETPEGRTYAALFSTRFDEVRGLIDGNRRVAVAWHRAGGPALVRAVLASAADPMLPLPKETEGLGRFLDTLARRGSPGLAADVERHRAALLVLGGTSLDEFLERLRAAA